MKPRVINYLKHNNLEQLFLDHGVESRPSTDFSKISLDYSQIDAKSGDKLAEECRGLIIRPQFQVEADNWKTSLLGNCEVVAWGMNRFYNFGDPACSKFDMNRVLVQEKLDGTMIMLYWDDKKNDWFAATRSVPEADFPINGGLHTFSSLFWETLRAQIGKITLEFWKDIELVKEFTYIFELMTPLNQVVVIHEKPKVSILARRSIFTGIEMPVYNGLLSCVNPPQLYEVPKSLTTFIEWIDNQDPKKFEGVVFCDHMFNRIKIKNKTYVLASKVKDSVCSSLRNAVEIILRKKADDVIPLLDNITAQKIIDLQEKISAFFHHSDELFHRAHTNTASRKDFALFLQNSSEKYLSGVQFGLYLKKISSTSDYFNQLVEQNKLCKSNIDSLLEII
jgi:hypothetical protein